MRTHRILSAIAAVAMATLLGSCGSTGSPSPNGAASATIQDPLAPVAVESHPQSQATPAVVGMVAAGTVAVGGVDPNAPEVHEVGDIPDNQVFVPYSTSTGLYTVSYPEGWSRIGDGDVVSFTDKLNAIEVAVVAKPVAPTVASVTAVDVPAIAAKSSNFVAGKVATVTRKGGDAVVAAYQIDSAPNAVTGKSIRVAVERYEFWRSGKSVVITLIGAVGADNVDPCKIVTDSFAWVK